MSFESPDNEKDFPGLYNTSDQISVTEEDVDKGSKKKDGKKEKKEKKEKEKKDKGYMMFEQEDSEDELVVTDDLSTIKSPSKIGRKIKPTFRFQKKDKSKERDEKKDKEGRKSDDKKKEEKEGKKEKHKLKDKKKSKHRGDVTALSAIPAGIPDKPVFGVPLSVAVDRSKCHDGIELPAIFRECVDYIEEHGLTCEGIYRISGVKSKVQQLKDCYNKCLPAYLCEHEANVVASLLKQFLRELPEPVLTTQLMPKFEEASTLKTEAKRLEAMRKLVQELPVCNRLLLSWMIVHMTHIIGQRTRNKMSLQNVSIVLSPTMQISHRVLNVFFCIVDKLFGDTQIKKYVPPLRPATSRWSLELPDSLNALEEELAKQESLLNALHEEFKLGVEDPSKEEQLWEVQRVVTQLKRKIKFAHKSSDRKKESKKPAMVSELEELNLDLQPVTEAVVERVSESDKEGTEIKAEQVENKSEEEKKISEQVEKTSEEEKETQEKPAEDSSESSLKSKDDEKPEEKLDEGSSPENKIEENVEENSANVEQTSANVEENSANVEETSANVEEDVSKDLEVKPSEEKSVKIDNDQKLPEPEVDSPPMEPPQTPEIEKEELKPTEDETMVTTPAAIEMPSVEEETVKEIPVEVLKKTEQPEVALPPQTVKPTGPIQPHLQLSQQPLKPIRVSDSIDGEPVLPEKEYKSVSVSADGDQPVQDEEMKKLLEEEYAMTLEEEELLSIGDELKQKIDTEQGEIERLKQEIVELQYLRQDSDLEDYSSTSESSDESEDEEELTELLNSLIAENEELEKKNSELCQKIHDERIACLDCKVSIRLIQQKQLDSDNILDTDNPI